MTAGVSVLFYATMTIDLACAKCEASFELEVTELLEEPGSLACPNCEARAPRRKVEALASALDDLLRSVAGLAQSFVVSFAAETDDLPAAYDPGGRGARKAAAEDDASEEDESEEGEEEELRDEAPEDEIDFDE